jgi:magnesium-transporting ATPase (P-type)
VRWDQIFVGDLIKIEDKQIVPSDVIILASSEQNGIAYCSTATLDGERTLKPKQSPSQTYEVYIRDKENFANGLSLKLFTTEP